MPKESILVTGASGQVGMDLVLALREAHGSDAVLATDIVAPTYELKESGPFAELDVLQADRIGMMVRKHQVTQIYHLASLLSAKSELKPRLAWQVNMEGLFNVLDVASETDVSKVFWPSSIAVFGPNSPKINTPQFTTMDPDTVYGISKLAGERWCHHYHHSKQLDVRSIRYPGVISYTQSPGGGTTDYAVEIFFKAVQEKRYECFLQEDTILPMIYMPDALRATIMLMEAPRDDLTLHSGYNVAGMSFSPREVAQEIQKHIPDFVASYKPDFRQNLADTWPESICDDFARADWKWSPQYSLEAMTKDMLQHIRSLATLDHG